MNLICWKKLKLQPGSFLGSYQLDYACYAVVNRETKVMSSLELLSITRRVFTGNEKISAQLSIASSAMKCYLINSKLLSIKHQYHRRKSKRIIRNKKDKIQWKTKVLKQKGSSSREILKLNSEIKTYKPLIILVPRGTAQFDEFTILPQHIYKFKIKK